MPRVICTLPNASETINGVAFTLDRGQMVSEEVDEATAANFAAIPGYQLVAPPPPPEQKPTENAPAAGEPASGGRRQATPKQKPVAGSKPADEKPADPAGAADGTNETAPAS